MSHRFFVLRMLSAMTAACALLLAAPLSAAPVTIDWDVVPHESGDLEPTPYYDCVGDFYTDRYCTFLWEEGLELVGDHPFFDDTWFDGYGYGDESDDTAFIIRPRCEPALVPCFDLFTAKSLSVSFDSEGAGRVFLSIRSSRGGVVKLDRSGAVNLRGSRWENISWLKIGFYLPRICDSDHLPDDFDFEGEGCNPDIEKEVNIGRGLTFEPGAKRVPEPGLAALLTAAMTGFACRRAAARRRKG